MTTKAVNGRISATIAPEGGWKRRVPQHQSDSRSGSRAAAPDCTGRLQLSSPAVTAGLQFLTRKGCHLCEEALVLLQGVSLEVIDIDDDPALHAEFDERVPVVRDAATGTILLEGKITETQVERIRRARSDK